MSARVGDTKNTEKVPENRKQRPEGYIREKSSNGCVIEGREGHIGRAESLGIPAGLLLY
jgi:hypothetical protein